MGEPLSITLRLVLVVALVLANGLFVAAEFSIITARRARIHELDDELLEKRERSHRSLGSRQLLLEPLLEPLQVLLL